jgi:hypothetical protein
LRGGSSQAIDRSPTARFSGRLLQKDFLAGFLTQSGGLHISDTAAQTRTMFAAQLGQIIRLMHC